MDIPKGLYDSAGRDGKIDQEAAVNVEVMKSLNSPREYTRDGKY